MSCLKRLPLDPPKIDRSFVRELVSDPRVAAIVQSIVSLGKSLGLQVIAEGVENEEQRLSPETLGCDSWQGFLLSSPVPVARFETLLRAWRGAPDPAGPPSRQDDSWAVGAGILRCA